MKLRVLTFIVIYSEKKMVKCKAINNKNNLAVYYYIKFKN